MEWTDVIGGGAVAGIVEVCADGAECGVECEVAGLPWVSAQSEYDSVGAGGGCGVCC